jgi:hypothetical protein
LFQSSIEKWKASGLKGIYIMMRHNKNKLLSTSFISALLSCTFLTASAANAFVSVTDSLANSRLATQVTNMQNQLGQLEKMRNLANQQLSAFGEFGTMGDIFGGTSFDQMGSNSTFYENMQKFAFDPCAINLCTIGDNPIGTTDFEEARDWAMKNFYTSEVLNNSDSRDLAEVRRRAVVYAATNGMALANIVHNDLAGSGEEAQALEDIVEASQNLRGDIRANTAVSIATYRIEIQKLAMLTSMLEVESASAIVNTSVFHEDGGSEYPDAFIDADYSANDLTRRVQVTIPEKGSPSGGSGMGGGLIGSLLGGSDSTTGVLLESAGLTDVASVFTSSDPSQALMDGITSGSFGSMPPESLNMGSVMADAANLTSNIASESGSPELAAPLRSIESGFSKGGTSGNAQGVMGVAQTLAMTGGNADLSSILNVGRISLDTGNLEKALSFAEGALSDLRRNGLGGSLDKYLSDQIEQVRQTSSGIEALVLDTSAMISAMGTSPDAQIARVLQVDVATLRSSDLQELTASAINAVGDNIDRPELRTIADGVLTINDGDLADIRDQLTSRTHIQGNTPLESDTTSSVLQ